MEGKRMADDAELYRDTELWTGMPVHEETEAQKAERLKREAKERRSMLWKKVFQFLKDFWNKVKGFVQVIAAIITILVGLKALGLI